MKASEKLLLIAQSQADADYILNEKNSCKHITKIFKLWIVQLSLYVILFYIIDNLNTYFALYETIYYYPIYNSCKVFLNVLMLIILWKFINKNSSLIERRFLKMWFVFPACLSLEQILVCVFPYINVDFLISYYSSFPLSIFINIIMLFYINSYFKNKNIFFIIVINIGYMLFSFLYSIYIPTVTNFSHIQSFLFTVIDTIKTYFMPNILSMIFILLCIGGDENE